MGIEREKQNFKSSPNSSEIQKDVIVVGFYPPPITGQSEAFRILVDGLNLPYHNLADLGYVGDGLSFFRRITRIGRSWFRFFWKCRNKKVAYFSVAQSTAGFFRDLGFFVAAWICRCKTVAHLHGRTFEYLLPAIPFLLRALIKTVYRRFNRVILLSPEFFSMMSFVQKSAFVVVPNGIPDIVQPGKRHWDSPIKVLYLSNLMPTKGVIPLIESMAFLPDHYHLILTGMPLVTKGDPFDSNETFEKHIQKTMDKVEGNNRIRRVGVVYGGEKSKLLRECHLLVLPAAHNTEAQPICVIEGMMAGMPCVVTPTGDLMNMVDDTCGRVIDSQDPKAIAKGILEITRDEKVYQRLSKAARKRALSRYSESRHLESMAEIFKEMLDIKQKGPR